MLRLLRNEGSFIFLWLSFMVHYFAFGLIYPILPLYFRHSGLSSLEIGALSSVGSMAMVIIPFYAGGISDSWGRTKMSLLCQLFMGILIPLYVFFTGFISFMPLHFLWSSLHWSYVSISLAMSVDIAKGGRVGRDVSLFRISGALGWVPGTFLSGFIVGQYGYESLFILSALMHGFSAILVSQVIEMKHEKTAAKVVFQVLRNRTLIVFFLICAIASFTTPAIFTFLPLYMESELDIPRSIIPLVFTITPLAEVPAMIFLGDVSDRIGRRKVIDICLLAYPIRFGIVMTATSYSQIIVSQLLHGLTFAGLLVISVAYLSDIVPKELRGFIVGAYHTVSGLGEVIGGYSLGFIVEEFGFRPMYSLIVAISAAAVFLFTILELGNRKQKVSKLL